MGTVSVGRAEHQTSGSSLTDARVVQKLAISQQKYYATTAGLECALNQEIQHLP